MNLLETIRTVPDYPKPGILFYDISTLLANPPAWHYCVTQICDKIRPLSPDLLVGIESRGFLLAAPLAFELGLGFAMARKQGKLPGNVVQLEYTLEYGRDCLEIQAEALAMDARIVVLDDLLATGGTMRAACDLVRKVGANPVMAACIMELSGLGGRERLDVPFFSQILCPAASAEAQ
ncbi:MAG: adenine phosphoribosyltransferase [Pseudomonadota bacterium]